MITEQIGEKPVYIVTSHHEVLVAWAAIRQTLSHSPILITLDHHTDTVLAFRHHLCSSNNYFTTSAARFTELADEECHKIDYRNLAIVRDAVSRLQNDEHIDAAIRAGIIDQAYAITYSAVGTCRVRYEHLTLEQRQILFGSIDLDNCQYEPPFTRIFEVATNCYPGCPNEEHTDACHPELYARSIDTQNLQNKFETINEMSRAFGIDNILDQKYILDIDLDYFHSAKSIAPNDAQMFYNLIRRAVAITIATEPHYVEACKLAGETITSDYLLGKLKAHIAKALE
jgi:hypothetical protein